MIFHKISDIFNYLYQIIRERQINTLNNKQHRGMLYQIHENQSILFYFHLSVNINSTFIQIKQKMADNNQKDKNVNEFNKFLENNHDFLQDKYNEYFKKVSLPTKDVNRNFAIKFIYDVFGFSKYESDEKMNATLQKSLLRNIQDYLLILNKKKSQFNYKTAVELLKYCIENNEMFAVKYDKKEKKIKTEQANESTFTEKEQGSHKNEVQSEVKEENEDTEKDKNEDQEAKSENVNEDQNNTNQFDQNNKQGEQRQTDPQIIKKNLKQMFQFYCKQQQNVGAHTTFDRISYECKTMTMGKFLAFGNSTGILNERIDKNLLMRKFKLVAEGKKQIQFEHFYQIIQTLAAIDDALIPKLGVDEKLMFKNKLKQRFMPFNTKDPTSRQPKRDYIFVPKLTQHSGKLSDALYQEIKIRKSIKGLGASHNQNKLNYESNSEEKSPTNIVKYEGSGNGKNPKQVSNIVASPTQLTNSNIRDFEQDLGFLDRMISAQEADEQWLKQYKIPSRKVLSKPPLMGGKSTRKQLIVPNLKKRVQQLERSETRQSVHLQRRQYGSNKRDRQKNSRSILS